MIGGDEYTDKIARTMAKEVAQADAYVARVFLPRLNTEFSGLHGPELYFRCALICKLLTESQLIVLKDSPPGLKEIIEAVGKMLVEHMKTVIVERDLGVQDGR